MARLVPAVTVLVALALFAGDALADGAEHRRGDRSDAVYIGDARVWSGDRGERVISTIKLSKRRDAVAFAARTRTGAVSLVVVLVGGDANGHTMRFPVPGKARRPHHNGSPTVTWMGKHRVAYGPGELVPTMVASWKLR